MVQDLPDAVILGAGSWDALHYPNTVSAEAPQLHDAIAKRLAKPLCKVSKKSSAAVDDEDQHPVFWVNQPRPVGNRLKTPEKREFVTDEAIVRSNQVLSDNSNALFAAVVDLYEVRSVPLIDGDFRSHGEDRETPNPGLSCAERGVLFAADIRASMFAVVVDLAGVQVPGFRRTGWLSLR